MNIVHRPVVLAVFLMTTAALAQEKNTPAASKATVLEPRISPSVEESNAKADKAGPAAGVETPETKAGEAIPRSVAAIRRDPFRPFTLNLRATVRRRDNLSPLERYELGQLKLVGIIWSTKNPTALVEDASGLGYTVRVGTPIGANDGKVTKITPNAVAVEEEYIDLYGAKKKREVSMRLAAEKPE